MLRRPPYPESLETRKKIEKHINELLDMDVITKIGHNEIVEITTCHNHGNSPPWIPICHIKPQFIYGQLAISITSGQYGHVIILWTIYGHL
ncbi:hypothetical protein O181_118874 [Austropuccinia psidii MF-1]|uniref:Uncharacterized protein n=1 Tax=Austropuccinia psidii MF-1 TaxID=1389203 RepID=A0A9Q3KG28_9BASI|nr:hypothetical protein [Austropuccinia psidii MF-1]